MFQLRFCVFTLLFFISVKSQQLDWDKINSNTVFNIIAGQNFEQEISYSNIIQTGNNNNAALYINDKTDIVVKQLGDYNTLNYINSFTDTETKTTITAQGNNNIIDITGSNSISDGLQIHVKGDNKTIFMRNY